MLSPFWGDLSVTSEMTFELDVPNVRENGGDCVEEDEEEEDDEEPTAEVPACTGLSMDTL